MAKEEPKQRKNIKTRILSKRAVAIWAQNGPAWEGTGDQNGGPKGRNHEKLIIQKPLFYLSKTMVVESQGGEKPSKRRPKTVQNHAREKNTEQHSKSNNKVVKVDRCQGFRGEKVTENETPGGEQRDII